MTDAHPAPPPPVVAERRRRSGCAIALAVAAIGCLAVPILYGLFVLGAGQPLTISRDLRATCVQPDDVTYADGRYEVTAWHETTLSLGSPHDDAVVGRAGNAGTYGVPISLSSGADPGAITCRWDPEGVDIVESNGMTHRVPASVFTGGR